MLEYAAADTHYLPQLRDILATQLAERGRLGWAEEEFALLEEPRSRAGGGAEPGWLRLKGAKALQGRELAILREIWEWREEIGAPGRQADVPGPQQRADAGDGEEPAGRHGGAEGDPGISAIRRSGEGRSCWPRCSAEWSCPTASCRRIVRPPRRAPDLAYEARLERLKAARNLLA